MSLSRRSCWALKRFIRFWMRLRLFDPRFRRSLFSRFFLLSTFFFHLSHPSLFERVTRARRSRFRSPHVESRENSVRSAGGSAPSTETNSAAPISRELGAFFLLPFSSRSSSSSSLDLSIFSCLIKRLLRHIQCPSPPPPVPSRAPRRRRRGVERRERELSRRRPESCAAATADCPPASATVAAAGAAASAVATRPRPRPRRRREDLIVSASASASSCRRSPHRRSSSGPPPFDPAKLTVMRLSGAEKESNSRRGRGGGNGSSAPATAAAAAGTSAAAATSKSPSPLFPLPRRYTLTHNDVTGALALSIGSEYNSAQLEGWYVRMIRDEVLAEWRRRRGRGQRKRRQRRSREPMAATEAAAALLLPPPLLPPLPPLTTPSTSSATSPATPAGSPPAPPLPHLPAGDGPRARHDRPRRRRAACRSHPGLGSARVVVHLRSHVRSLDARLVWGTLGDRGGWREPPRLLEGLLEGGSVFFFSF